MFGRLRVEVESLDGVAQLARLREIERQERALAAEKALIVSAAERTATYATDGHATVAGWVRANTGRSNAETAATVRLARLVHEMPVCGEALYSSRIGVAHAGELAKARRNPRCGSTMVDAIDLLLARADGAFRESDVSHESRQATVAELDGGIFLQATGGSTVAAAELIEIFERFRQAEFLADCDATSDAEGPAPAASQLPRTDSQRRFDALCTIFRTAASSPIGGQAPEPVVNIVIDQQTFEDHLEAVLSGRRVPERSARDIVTNGRCETLDGRLVNPRDAVAAALIGHVRRVVFDASGTVIDLGRRQRLFTGAAREAVRLQGRRCCYAGCTVDVGRCQIDHTQPWAAGGGHGSTDPSNGAPICPRHNRFKNRGFTTRRDPDGAWHTYRPDGTEVGAPVAVG